MPQPILGRDSEEEFNAKLAKEMNKRTLNLQNNEIDLAIRTKEAREFIAWSVENIKRDWLDWLDASNDMLLRLRQTRMAVETEARILMETGRDVRKFFLNPEHNTEIAKLKDFVETAERLIALKENGTLDALADVILKLSVK